MPILGTSGTKLALVRRVRNQILLSPGIVNCQCERRDRDTTPISLVVRQDILEPECIVAVQPPSVAPFCYRGASHSDRPSLGK